ncbi:MAG TPA: hypothetical protein VLX61_13945 [Anaerolineales bacterium]|nr:hypothetical protein [Anaerolineales bacterium]
MAARRLAAGVNEDIHLRAGGKISIGKQLQTEKPNTIPSIEARWQWGFFTPNIRSA